MRRHRARAIIPSLGSCFILGELILNLEACSNTVKCYDVL
jgi:hypothetical protein